jgi:hypothetical protein
MNMCSTSRIRPAYGARLPMSVWCRFMHDTLCGLHECMSASAFCVHEPHSVPYVFIQPVGITACRFLLANEYGRCDCVQWNDPEPTPKEVCLRKHEQECHLGTSCNVPVSL